MIPNYTLELSELFNHRKYEELIKISQKKMNDDPFNGEAVYWYIFCLFQLDRKNEAIEVGTDVLHKIIDNTWKGRIHNRVGSFFWRTGDLKNAEDHYKLSIELLTKYGTKRDLSSPINNLGIIYDVSGELNKSLIEYTKALSLVDKNDDLYASVLVNVGIIYFHQREDKMAEKTFLEALGIFKKENRKEGIMVVSHHLQLLYIRSERIDEAKTMFNQLQDIARTREDSFTQSLYQISKAIILKTSKRMKDVVETMRILDNIIDDPIFEYEHKTMALIYLTELKLNEYKVLANSDVLQEIKLLINKIQDFAEDNHSYPLVIKTKLLKIRLQTVQGKFNEVRKMLDASYDFVNYHNLGYLKELIKDEDDYFESNLVKLQSIFNQNKSEIENMELKSIQDYLKSIQSLIR